MTEFELIDLLTEGCAREAADLAVGVGDDCAVISGPADRDWLVTSDSLVEGVHFARAWTGLAALGRKALAVNLSDIAAMGGAPRFWLASIAIPDDVGPEGAGEIYRGMRAAADEHGALLVGGDTSGSRGGLMISITAIGDVPRGKALLRSGAKPGDAIFVTGELGGAAMGLACLRVGRTDGSAAPFVKRHLEPRPRLDVAKQLLDAGVVSSMVDISDGLLADLGHIACASCAGFEVEADAVPVPKGIEGLAAEMGGDPLAFALAGGEDYELAFTVEGGRADEFERSAAAGLAVPVTRIGRMIEDASARRAARADGSEVKLGAAGFDHFARGE